MRRLAQTLTYKHFGTGFSGLCVASGKWRFVFFIEIRKVYLVISSKVSPRESSNCQEGSRDNYVIDVVFVIWKLIGSCKQLPLPSNVICYQADWITKGIKP